MAEFINLYCDNPTENEKTGTLISSGTGESPLAVVLDATQNESKVIKCGIRTMEGYKTSGETKISFEGDSKAKWSICATENGEFADSLTIADSIGDVNKIFYVKASSSNDEKPNNDKSVSIKVTTKIEAAEESQAEKPAEKPAKG